MYQGAAHPINADIHFIFTWNRLMTELSPAAQAVADATEILVHYGFSGRAVAAAALRAAADQVVPADPDMPERWEERDEIRSALLAIVFELENVR